jgi:hypothetical protein
LDDLKDRLDRGEWNVKREAGGSLAGTSILVRALVEHTGKTVEVIKAFLSAKSQGEKLALRNAPAILPIVQRLEISKVKKASTVDTDALLGELGE